MKFIFSLFIITYSLGVQAFTIPELLDPVVDQAGLIDPSVAEKLSRALRSINEKGGPQLTIFTVDSIGDLPIEEASIRVSKAWKLGTAKKDNGILLMVAKKEHRIRIEVGQGVEGDLTDAYSRRIIDDVMVPLFREGHTSEAFLLGVDGILKRMNPPILLEDYLTVHRSKKVKLQADWVHWVVFGCIFFLFLFGGGGRRGRGSSVASDIALGALLGSLGGGGRSSGGGGGGGWSGGGGGFSGGGASGSW